MKDVYNYAIGKVKDGAKFYVNFKAKTLSINGKKIIDNGKYEGSLGIEKTPLDKTLKNIEFLYDLYKHSLPSERSENKRRRYFKALKEHELSDNDMMFGNFRDVAQISLEAYVLCASLNGSLYWDEENMGKWFWQSTNDKDLVILKEWI